ncbi:Eco57I restriction-modification methylase domain-containing protein [Burkholderia ambifaria]|uniref:Eco57I restriction-modification methylase domain-containing protein n=1 Tax=Burkholderia ambifaria TaxID=152480 RepID=UPI00158E45ED|nr:DNA methyltransferase [Burkholderia ambifaria]
MSITRHHADWLSLLEVSGPFVSLPILMRAFPQGLEPRDPAQAKVLRAAYEEWHDNSTAPGKQRAWVMHVLTSVLGYPENQIAEGQALPAGLEASMREVGETLRPDFALVGPAGTATAGLPQLLITNYTAEQGLDKPVIGKHWKATPATRMMELLHVADLPLGLVTNGEQWMLVYAPRGETTGYASWFGALWLDEPITLRAFHSLLGVRRFFGVAADSTLLSLLKESASDQQEVTDQLGYQVRQAVEVLVQSFDALNRESQGASLKSIPPATVYDAALTVMMRLVFLFSAEERGLLHLGKPLYDDNYAVSTLQEQLQEVADQYGEEVLERRSDAWARLLATFRAVHGGIQHQDLLMQAYGGSLFDPDRYPFLECRTAGSKWRTTPSEPLAVNNRVVLHLLNSLQRLRTKTGGAAETRRVSFRALGVEQIGHVYEGLLDHTAIPATEVVLGIRGTRSKEPEIPLSTLERLLAQGEDKLLDHLKEATARSLPALRKEFNNGSILEEHKLLVACNHDEALVARLRPFAGLIREDSFERPWVVLPGSVFVTAGTTRRSTGTHYTPPSLTEPIVQHTLEPLVYAGPAEGLPKEQWRLKSPREILDLKVCDMAMGSGAFLVQACRYLAERLVEAWENEEKAHPGQVLITPDGNFSKGSPTERLVPAEAAERIAIARRVVADRCLYGVDINPMAVEMAKLSMWLITVDRDRPFTFLDHAFKCGDSLLGVAALEQLERFSLRPSGGTQQAFATLDLSRYINEAKEKRKALELMPSDTREQIADKAALYAEAEEAVARLNAVADVLVALELKGLKGKAYEAERQTSADQLMAYWEGDLIELQTYARQQLGRHRCFHWELAFPEMSAPGGFDAIVGNPPFMRGTKIQTNISEAYLRALLACRGRINGNADLCTHFFRAAFDRLKKEGRMGLLATNTISQGDTRESGLAVILGDGGSIYRATTSAHWPGVAAVVVSIVWILKSKLHAASILDGVEVDGIDSFLSIASSSPVAGPYSLSSTLCNYHNGSFLNGLGFILTVEEAEKLLAAPTYDQVVKPYIGGKETYAATDPTIATRYIIYFGKMPREKAEGWSKAFDILKERVQPERSAHKTKQLREQWWVFKRPTPDLYEECKLCRRVIVKTQVSSTFAFVFVPSSYIFDQRLIVFPDDRAATLAILQSSIHELWSTRYAATLKEDMSYTPSDCFETFPPPSDSSALESLGEKYSECRAQLMLSLNIGLTSLYKLFHDPGQMKSDIDDFRRLHVEVDQAVAAAYGWRDLELAHGFHETKQGLRYTISESAGREVLQRLLALNHQLHAEEQKREVGSARTKPGRTRSDPDQLLMDL